jgi:two-component system sensor histidine kinase KdpD
LRADSISRDDFEELLAVVATESERLAHLVDDLLDLSRIQAGAAGPQPDWCDLGEIAMSAADAVSRREESNPIEVDVPAELPLVRADPIQIERVLVNLIDNAVKFSPTGASVRVSAGSSEARVNVHVQDQGSGVTAAQRPFVFEPFFRGDDAPGAGSGLGLAISKGFVEANGGRIALRAGSGGGSVFTVSFPLVLQPQTPAPPADHR